MSSISFTGVRAPRFPAPDVARGFMLALIALANVPWWLGYFPGYPQQGSELLAMEGTADQWWFVIRAMLVDRRAYPLFSILFGFGVAMMASRIIARERRAAQEIAGQISGGWTPVHWQIWNQGVEYRARVAASRLIRRRGLWMLAFGAVHGTFFAGDIIGAYGLVAVIFAEVIVTTNKAVRWAIGGGIAFLSLALLWISGVVAQGAQQPYSLAFTTHSGVDASYLLVNAGNWVVGSVITVLAAMVVPCVFIGVALCRLGWLEDPRAHAGALWGVAVGGLGVGALGALPYALGQVGWAFAGAQSWAMPLFHLSGVAGACGWLALLTIIAGGPREKLGPVQWFLSAIGRRSMSAYVAQTILFILVFSAMGLAGVDFVASLMGAGIALCVWAVIGVWAAVSEARGSARGPLERLLRWLVSRWASPLPELPFVDAQNGAGNMGWPGAQRIH